MLPLLWTTFVFSNNNNGLQKVAKLAKNSKFGYPVDTTNQRPDLGLLIIQVGHM
jgi:hypothetical protein